LYFYNARWYDNALGRFTSPDSIIPEANQGVQAWDRYAYSNNNPLLYTESGHMIDDGCRTEGCSLSEGEEYQAYVYNVLHNNNERQENNQKVETGVLVIKTVVSILWEPADWTITASECLNGDCSPFVLVGLLPLIPSSIGKHADDVLEYTEKHHTIPKQILNMLPKDIADAVRGVKGASNILQIPKSVHRIIHSGSGSGGYYNAAWRIALDKLRRSGNVITQSDILKIREQLVNTFGLWKWIP
jgi:hypothetical protein